MDLRITAGEFKNRRLASLPGKELRPLSGRIKEALFSIISEIIPGAVFLDLFAGTGNVGFEALSRGASKAFLVEKDPASLRLIRKNIEILGVSDRVEMYSCDVFDFHRDLSADIIFAGPPYRPNLTSRILTHCRDSRIIRAGSLLIIQHHRKEPVEHSGYEISDSRTYGITTLDFFRLKE